ncbi:MAG: helix-turn-helix domain-containing protein [Chthoniobacteraceae bacterium]
MFSELNAPLISIPYGVSLESRQSRRYSFDNFRRGPEPMLIIQLTRKGEGCFFTQGREYPVKAGEAFLAFIPEQSAYYFPKQAPAPWKFAWLNIYGDLGLSLFRQFRNQFGPVVALPEGSAAGTAFLRLTKFGNAGKFADVYEASAAGYGFLMEWSRQLTRPLYQHADPIQAAKAMFSSRFREPLGVKELAAQTGLSREHFSRIFTQRVGKSPAAYLRDIRTNAARKMLQNHQISLSEIALRCGFLSVRNLRRALVNAEGVIQPKCDG